MAALTDAHFPGPIFLFCAIFRQAQAGLSSANLVATAGLFAQRAKNRGDPDVQNETAPNKNTYEPSSVYENADRWRSLKKHVLRLQKGAAAVHMIQTHAKQMDRSESPAVGVRQTRSCGP